MSVGERHYLDLSPVKVTATKCFVYLLHECFVSVEKCEVLSAQMWEKVEVENGKWGLRKARRCGKGRRQHLS